MQTTKPQKINLIDNLKQYDAKVISAQNCLKLYATERIYTTLYTIGGKCTQLYTIVHNFTQLQNFAKRLPFSKT
jgi:hypothetical protein